MAGNPVSHTEFVAPTTEELAPLFPQYEIVDLIAQGGMGAVYRARQKSLDRMVAIKILPREFGADEQFREAFEAEAKAMARLNHPNLIAVYDFGDIEGMLYIVMEFVEGKALYYSSHGKKIDPATALEIVSTIARGLSHAHKGGIIHRDIKPANILLDPDAQPKIGDFGLARPLDRDRAEGVTLGTPGYTAPEVYSREHPVDQRSDIFSLGALLYELLCGKHPEPGSSGMKSRIDPRIDAFLAKATHANPSHRYMDVEDFAQDLDSVVDKLSGPRLAVAAPSSGATVPPMVKPLASSKKSSALPVLAILAIFVGIAAWALTTIKDEDPKETTAPEVQPEVPEKPDKPPNDKRDRKEKERNKPKPRMVETPKPSPKPKKEDKPVVEETPAETPLQALSRLKTALAGGARTEFPPTSVKNGTSTYLLVPTKLTWREARDFAEEHGARLASLQTSDKLKWAAGTFKDSLPSWVGASDSGTEKRWFWNDGTAVDSSLWAEGQPDDNTSRDLQGEDFATLSQKGPNLEDQPDLNQHPFILEWQNDGARPGALDEQLTRTGDALRTKRPPIFPNGTFNIGGARFLLIKRSLDWNAASKLAQDAGGHLAVLSNAKEAAFAYQYLKDRLPEDSSCWFGAKRNELAPDVWKNVTGELFEFHQWFPGQPDNFGENENHLVLLHKGGAIGANDASSEASSADYLLLEWSVPSLQNLPKVSSKTGNLADAEEALEKIREEIRDLHGREYRKHRRKHDDAVEDFIKDAISEVNDTDRLSAPLRAEAVEYLEGFLEQNKLPDELPKRAPDSLNRELKEAKAEVAEANAAGKQNFDIAKGEYLKALSTTATVAFGQGHDETGNALTIEGKLIAANDDRFHAIMSNRDVPFPVEAPPPAEEENNEGEDL